MSTNSICQGEPVEFLWRPILEAGWRCRFAHRSFQWVTEATGGAAVHVSIVGFDKLAAPTPVLWTYPNGGRGEAVRHEVPNINPYLCDAITVLVSNRTTPISSIPPVTKGNQPTDGGNLLVTPDQHDSVAGDLIAARYLRRFVGARELIHDLPRWCLWLVDASTADIDASPVLRERVAAVRKMREASSKAATVKKAATSHLFDERRHPDVDYLAIPRHVGEQRWYFTARRLTPDTICSDANFLTPDPDGFVLGVLSSSMFIAWMRAIGGRIKSDLRFSNTFVYNTFPFPSITAEQRQRIIEASAQIIASREDHPRMSLAELYEPDRTPTDVIVAHDALDKVIDAIFGVDEDVDGVARQQLLFKRYAALIANPPNG